MADANEFLIFPYIKLFPKDIVGIPYQSCPLLRAVRKIVSSVTERKHPLQCYLSLYFAFNQIFNSKHFDTRYLSSFSTGGDLDNKQLIESITPLISVQKAGDGY